RALLAVQGESAFPFHPISAAMGEERRAEFDYVTRLEPIFAEQFRGQFHARDVAKISVDAGEVHDSNRWLINDRLQSGPDARPNGLARAADGDAPFGAVARAYCFIAVKCVLDNVLRV